MDTKDAGIIELPNIETAFGVIQVRQSKAKSEDFIIAGAKDDSSNIVICFYFHVVQTNALEKCTVSLLRIRKLFEEKNVSKRFPGQRRQMKDMSFDAKMYVLGAIATGTEFSAEERLGLCLEDALFYGFAETPDKEVMDILKSLVE